MSLNDPLANVLSHIQNYELLGKKEVITRNNSKFIRSTLAIMREHGYIGEVEEIKDNKGGYLKINLLGKINKTGVIKPRFQIAEEEFIKFEKRYLPAKNFGIIIVSTSQGLLVHTQAKEKKIGGRLISYCY
ncbi:MAG: 30S ribosomal protein S8 [Candidatus Woesearchaeota archaeon]